MLLQVGALVACAGGASARQYLSYFATRKVRQASRSSLEQEQPNTSNAAGGVGTSAGPSAGSSSGDGVDHRERDDSEARSLSRPGSAAR